jgi:hypothetical protein
VQVCRTAAPLAYDDVVCSTSTKTTACTSSEWSLPTLTPDQTSFNTPDLRKVRRELHFYS